MQHTSPQNSTDVCVCVWRVWRVDLVCRDTVELWQQPETIFLLDQDPLQGLLVLLNLVDGLAEVAASHFSH